MDRIVDLWGERTPHGRDTAWPTRVDKVLEPGVDEPDVDWVTSACVLCSNGCGVDIAVKDGRMVGVRGRATDTVNHGRLGPKGLYASWPWASSPDRLTKPLMRVDGRLVETDWDTAMDRIVQTSKRLLVEKGPLSHGFYTSGQLFLEEYYTLALIGKAGVGTPHMDGNTRLCTATAAASLKESFGCDGQPGSFADIGHCDAIFMFGHNMAETQTVLWGRVLDRIRGADPPVVVCVDPRNTAVAQEARRTGGVHLQPRLGTNLALMNGLTHELIANNWIDYDWVVQHVAGMEQLWRTVEQYPPARVAEICDVPADELARAARIFGESERVLSTVLQGFYQSHQATAASVAVNNLHLLRGQIGRPGCGILQMNGQPTAQNNRETGADGDFSGFRNWDNRAHIDELAALWNVDTSVIPHWSEPTHAMQIFRYVEQGSINLLWVSATNPAVSLPQLPRIREILSKPECLLIVQDLFLTETAMLADVVLPAAGWGEKTGTFTNTNRVVHLSDQAVPPPGEARSDLDIFCDYARRMEFTDRDGRPLVKWDTAEAAFRAWQQCSRGRPCDYTGLSYDMLRSAGTGIPWPCNDQRPSGTERLYVDGIFPTDTDYCETYGHDLVTGASNTRDEHAALRLDGRAQLKAADYLPPPEEPDDRYPLSLTTGRTVYHFHTRTKTARSRQLDAAAPTPWVEVAASDAARLGVVDGDLVRLSSRRGDVDAPVRIGNGRPGVVFVPFHYGYWDHERAAPNGDPTAANEATLPAWDPVSKQPLYKLAAVRLQRAEPKGHE